MKGQIWSYSYIYVLVFQNKMVYPSRLPSSGFYNVQDKLYCQLYDETIVDLLEDDRQRETNIHQRLQRQWLGSLQIPFSSLCSNARVNICQCVSQHIRCIRFQHLEMGFEDEL